MLGTRGKGLGGIGGVRAGRHSWGTCGTCGTWGYQVPENEVPVPGNEVMA